ncbi:MAG TPA: class I SAM-dependent methyltransferase [Vicinamibacterales bacterium]
MTDAVVRQHHEAQRAYFQSADQPTMIPEKTPYVRRHFRELVEGAALTPGARVLEIGSGLGRFTHLLDEHGFRVVGTDISPGQIEALKRRFPHIETIVGAADELPIPASPFDAVVGFFMLHHLPDLPAAFRRCADLLRPGGVVAFCEPNAWYLPFYLQVLLTPRMRWSVERGIRNMRRGVLEPALTAAGFRDVSFRYYGWLPPALYNLAVGRALESAVDALPLPGAARAFVLVTARRA